MGNFKIRNKITYQVDYLDLKNINIPTDKIIKDLKNIELLNNDKDSSHVSLLLDYEPLLNEEYSGRNYSRVLKDILFSTVGIPYTTWTQNKRIEGVRNTFDLSNLLPEVQKRFVQTVEKTKDSIPVLNLDYKRENIPDKKDFSKDIVGVMFIHTLVYDSELSLLATSLVSTFPKSKLLSSRISNKEAHYSFNLIDMPLYEMSGGDMTIPHVEEIETLKDTIHEPKAFTIIIPIYKIFDFINPDMNIYEKKSEFKEHSLLNWCITYRQRRYNTQYPVVDPFVNEQTLNKVEINFTYFPSEMNKQYYNKYVEHMADTNLTNFTRSSFLKSGLTSIEHKNADKIWSSLTKTFNYSLFPENIINTMMLNGWSGTFNRRCGYTNDIERLYTKDYFSVSASVFILNFLGGTELQKLVLRTMDSNKVISNKEMKAVTIELILSIKSMNQVCEEIGIDPIVPEKLQISLLSYLYHIFFINKLEEKLSGKNKRSFNLNYKNKVISNNFSVGSFRNRFDMNITNEIALLVKTHSHEEIIDIMLKARELYYSYIKESFISFLRLNKDFKEIIDSWIKNKSSEHILAKLGKDNTSYDYNTVSHYFFNGGGYLYNYVQHSIDTQFDKFIDRQIRAKHKSALLNPRRRLPEYRLFDVMCMLYKGNPLKYTYVGANAFDQSEYLYFFEIFRSNKFTEQLKKKLSFEEHIKNITTTFETIFSFSRII